jgi:hypothetical protein
VDRAYVDKTFNGQSWFRYREEALRKEPMNTREQTYAAIRKMLATLEDPFTRFLEPEKFTSLRVCDFELHCKPQPLCSTQLEDPPSYLPAGMTSTSLCVWCGQGSQAQVAQ